MNPVAEAWDGPVGAHWAEHQDRYDAMVSDFNDALFAAAAIGERDRVLDIGCGSGRTTRLARPYEAGRGVVMRAGVWMVGAVRP